LTFAFTVESIKEFGGASIWVSSKNLGQRMAFDNLKCLTFKLEARRPQIECSLGFFFCNLSLLHLNPLYFLYVEYEMVRKLEESRRMPISRPLFP
jgi:hypothetical protein